MEAISQWFKGSKDYYKGVAIYASLDSSKLRVVKKLNRGKTNQNMSTLIMELRKYNNQRSAPEPKPIVKPEVIKNPSQTQINTELQRKQLADESASVEFNGIMLGDLPAELRPRYIRARTIFYAMVELKFALNDLDDSQDEEALNLLKQIFALDDERDLIWEELNHWKKHRTLLPLPEDELSGLSPVKLIQKKNNLKSNISKITKRIDAKYVKLESLTDGHDKLLLESSIRKSEELLHQHKTNFKRINDMI